ncbi:hypothetical protein AUP68_11125 [Ilyonectria robusta]
MEYDPDTEAFNWDQQWCSLLSPSLDLGDRPHHDVELSWFVSVDRFSPPTASSDVFNSNEFSLSGTFQIALSNTGTTSFAPCNDSPAALPQTPHDLGGLHSYDKDHGLIDEKHTKLEYAVNPKNLSPQGTKRSSQASLEEDEDEPPATQPHDSNMNASAKTRTSVKLRSASRKRKTPSLKTIAGKKVHVSPAEKQARHCHNQVEKQYRNRLNLQFENLLTALPAVQSEDEHVDGLGDGHDKNSRCFSRAEVLGRAKRRIKSLERDYEVLAMERDRLLADITRIQQTIN